MGKTITLKLLYKGLYRTLGNAYVYMTDYVEQDPKLYKQLGFMLDKEFKPAIQLFYNKNGDTPGPTKDCNLMRCLETDEFTHITKKVQLDKIEEAKQHVMSRM